MAVTREELIEWQRKRIKATKANIEHHNALDTSSFPYEQMQVYRNNVKELSERLERYEAILKILEEGV